MKAKRERSYRLSRWGVATLSALLALAIAGSGSWGVSAAAPPSRSEGRDQPAGSTQAFEDVPPTDPFFGYVNTLYAEGIISGYPCGGVGEPCVPPLNRPYYRPSNKVTRGQMSKIINTSQNITTNDIISPFKIITNAPRGVGVWGGTGGVGPSRDINNINAGLYGVSTAISNSIGLLAVSQNDNAAWFASNSTNSYSIYVPNNGANIARGGTGPGDALYVNGHMTITGGCSGCTLDEIMLNTGTTDLRPGDVVSLGTLAPEGTVVNGNPVAGVTASTRSYDTGVVGVVGTLYIPGDSSAPAGTMQRTGGPDDTANAIKPGQYMTVITHGTYKLVKVDAAKGSIHVGDLLTTGETPGAAVKSTDKIASIGAVLGKAMGNLDTGTGYIPVLVTLR